MKTNATKSHIYFKKDDVACKNVNAMLSSFGQGVSTLQEWRNSGTWAWVTPSLVSWKPTMCLINTLWGD